MVDKMCHATADLYHVENRGYLREGYFADLVLVDPKSNYRVDKANIAMSAKPKHVGHFFLNQIINDNLSAVQLI